MDLTSSRSRWIRAVWILRRSTIQALVTFLPKGGHAVVSGFPDEEGNSVEVIRALASRWCGAVYWLGAPQPTRLSWMLADAKGSARVRIVRRRSLLGLLLYATAKIAFFTHGLYSSPRPPSNATFVNLWHGDGPKR